MLLRLRLMHHTVGYKVDLSSLGGSCLERMKVPL
jgi:hypothetical protein